jgi:serine/threonine protein kinase
MGNGNFRGPSSYRLPAGYSFLRNIGSGSFGEVVVATKNDREYVLKLMKDEVSTNANELRIMTEAQVLEHVKQKNIVQLYEIILSPPCLVLEYCESGNLWQQVTKQPRKNIPLFLVQTGLDICSALVTVHAHHIIHGDIKPENILYTWQGKELVAKLADFGVSRTFDSSLKAATVEYLPPKYPIGFPSDPRLDLYALGLSLYFAMFIALHGKRNMKSLQELKVSPEISPQNPHISTDFERILLKSIDVRGVDFTRSYARADELFLDLKSCESALMPDFEDPHMRK